MRVQITFGGNRTIVLKLDPMKAPINVANLVLLARQKFFDGRRVPLAGPPWAFAHGYDPPTLALGLESMQYRRGGRCGTRVFSSLPACSGQVCGARPSSHRGFRPDRVLARL